MLGIVKSSVTPALEMQRQLALSEFRVTRLCIMRPKLAMGRIVKAQIKKKGEDKEEKLVNRPEFAGFIDLDSTESTT